MADLEREESEEEVMRSRPGIRFLFLCVFGCFHTVVSVSFVAACGGGEASLQSCDGEQEEAGLRRKYTQEAAESTQEAALPPRPVPTTGSDEVQQLVTQQLSDFYSESLE